MRIFWIGLVLLPAAVMAMSGRSDDLELLGNEVRLHGRIIDQPCTIAPDSLDQTVDMGVVDVRELYANGGGAYIPFTIRLNNCKPGIFKAARVTFSGKEDGVMSGALGFTQGSAAGAGLRLYDDRQGKIELGQQTHGYTLSGGSENELLFSARVEGHPDAIINRTITPGSYGAVANFVVAYE